MENRRGPRLLVAAIVGLAVAGCGWRNDGRYQVTGSVLLDGQPLDHGDIMFKPADRSQGAVGGVIRAGNYAVRCPPGEARVEINASRIADKNSAAGLSAMPNDPGGIVVEIIPRSYNVDSMLKATVEPHERNVANFRLDGN